MLSRPLEDLERRARPCRSTKRQSEVWPEPLLVMCFI